MAFECSYAGIPFNVEIHDDKISEWIDRNMPLAWLQEGMPPQSSWSGPRATSDLGFTQWPGLPPVRIGEFFYPTGASRWGIFRGIAVGDAAAQMQAAGLPTSGPQPCAFVMRSDVAGASPTGGAPGLIQTPMWLLPPRPLANHSAGPDTLYLITLVDTRFLWQFGTAGLIQNSALASWEQLIASVITSVPGGVSVPNMSGYDAIYGTPEADSDLWTNHESLGTLLDAIGANLGWRFVRNLGANESFQFQTQVQAAASTTASRPAPVIRISGGDEVFEQAGSNLGTGYLPQSVLVLFPKYVTGQIPAVFIDGRGFQQPPITQFTRDSYGDVYAINIDLGTLIPGSHAYPGYKVLRTTAKAGFNTATDPAPYNLSNLQALANQLAINFFGWLKINTLDETYPGIYPWTADGLHDVLWTYRGGKNPICCTRVLALPINYGPERFQHALGVSGQNPLVVSDSITPVAHYVPECNLIKFGTGFTVTQGPQAGEAIVNGGGGGGGASNGFWARITGGPDANHGYGFVELTSHPTIPGAFVDLPGGRTDGNTGLRAYPAMVYGPTDGAGVNSQLPDVGLGATQLPALLWLQPDLSAYQFVVPYQGLTCFGNNGGTLTSNFDNINEINFSSAFNVTKTSPQHLSVAFDLPNKQTLAVVVGFNPVTCVATLKTITFYGTVT